MYYFSDEFLKTLKTKSEPFQDKFFSIMDEICSYLETDEEIRNFHEYIEENHTYSEPGNILFETENTFCGQYDKDELKEKIQFTIFGLFDGFDSADAMHDVSHIVFCISAPKEYFNDKDIDFFRSIFAFERICRDCPPPLVTGIFSDNVEGKGMSLFVAGLK
ncbi:MAG: hypothetical protein IKU84_03395 [Clostridia bacterium]|nr:hypothetical protein [Clostridia bacterium]